MIFGQQMSTTRRPMLVHTLSRTRWARNASMKSHENWDSPILLLLLIEIDSGSFANWSKNGMLTWTILFFLLGHSALMRVCPSGTLCIHALDGYTVPGSPIPLRMTMCCGKSGVMMKLELVKGKDHSRRLGQNKYEEWRLWQKDSWSSFEDAEEVFLHWKMCHPWFWFLCIEGNCWIKEGRIFCQCLKQETMLLAISCPWGSNWLTTHTSNARRLEILMFSVGVWVMWSILFGVWKSQTMWWRLWVPVVPWLQMYARKQEGCGPREMSYTEKSCTWSPSIGIFTTNTLSTTTTTYAILFQVLKTLWGPIAG